MKSIINGYYFAIRFEPPTKPKNRLSLAKGLREHRRRKNEVVLKCCYHLSLFLRDDCCSSSVNVVP